MKYGAFSQKQMHDVLIVVTTRASKQCEFMLLHLFGHPIPLRFGEHASLKQDRCATYWYRPRKVPCRSGRQERLVVNIRLLFEE